MRQQCSADTSTESMSFEPATKQPDSIIKGVQKMGFTMYTELAKKVFRGKE